MNKQNLWFVTLFSLVLVLSVYYVTMPNDLLLTEEKDNKTVNVSVEEVGVIDSLKLNKQEDRNEEKEGFKSIITNTDSSIDDINNAMDKMKSIEQISILEEKIEKNLKTNYKLDCCVEINNQIILSTCSSKNHDKSLANNIMRSIQENFDSSKTITVKFEK